MSWHLPFICFFALLIDAMHPSLSFCCWKILQENVKADALSQSEQISAFDFPDNALFALSANLQCWKCWQTKV